MSFVSLVQTLVAPRRTGLIKYEKHLRDEVYDQHQCVFIAPGREADVMTVDP